MSTTERFTELTNKLREIFQLDTQELDFGIYKILKIRNDEINSFLTTVLEKNTEEILTELEKQETTKMLQELHQLEHTLRDAGIEPSQAPKYKELKSNLEKQKNELSDAEGVVYSHLLTFFNRYYDKGDFISKRRIKKGDAYAIPYNGEEVKLHWANADQYYVKSGENFKNYDFLLANGNRVRFKLVSASTTQNNVKDTEAVRCFVLWNPSDNDDLDECDEGVQQEERPADFVEVIDLKDEEGKVVSRELVVYFQYVKFPKGTKQADFNQKTLAALTEKLTEQNLLAEFPVDKAEPKSKNPKKPQDKEISVLEYQLKRYTETNSSDYFVHKDLGGFLTRELDFYIKNEMMNLDDIGNADTFSQIEGNFTLIKAVRAIALKIIAFLAQIENFQRKLWLKKKFVTQCDYCITLDRLPEALRKKAFENPRQVAEWKRLGLWQDGMTADNSGCTVASSELFDTTKQGLPQFNHALMVDTKFFDYSFKAELLKEIDNLDEQCDGIIIKSENFQALNLLQERYREKVDCVYIDPPYNTGADGFVYKDNYQHSSWISTMQNRLETSKFMLKNTSLSFISIDDHEIMSLRAVMNIVFPGTFHTQVIIQSNKRGQTYQEIAKTHEYLLVNAIGKKSTVNELSKDLTVKGSLQDNLGSFELWELRNRNPKYNRKNRPNLFYPIYVNPNDIDDLGYASISLQESALYSIKILPQNSANEDSCWRWSANKLDEAIRAGHDIIVAKRKITGEWGIFQKSRKDVVKAKSIWDEKEVISEQGTVHLGHLGFKNFGFPKPPKLVTKVLLLGTEKYSQILDYFAGSGTTADAVINLNRQDGGHRKYILVEMGEHFDTVLKPRLEKVVYSPDWKDGKPMASNQGISHCFKYMTLESYEDTLTNLEKMEQKGQTLLNNILKSEYVMKYMLDIESRESLLSTDIFKKPFDYTLETTADASGATRQQSVDLVETFNYLIGLTVESMDYKVEADGKVSMVTVIGSKPNSERVLVLWRDCDIWTYDKLNGYLDKQEIKADTEFATIYVNGDHSIKNAIKKTDGQEVILKIQDIESEFFKKMFGEE